MSVPNCPICGAKMVPMSGKAAGKGWKCSKQRWTPKTGQTGCAGVIWNNKTPFIKREETPRAADWLKLAKLTKEQEEIREILASSPKSRGGRLLIVDAGPGTGKSTTMGLCAQTIFKRVCQLLNWFLVAFNVNARISLEGKLPSLWPNIATINSFGGRIQGFNARQYKTAKVRNIFKELVEGLPKEERPHFGIIGQLCERGRDLLLYNDSTDESWWKEAIISLCCRFPGIQKRMDKEKHGMEIAQEYFPVCMHQALRNGREIDLTEQYARPVLLAIKESGWKMPFEACQRGYEWTAKDIQHLASLIRKVSLPQVDGVIVDEAQDLSLSQIVLFLACTWRSGELILVGDDKCGEPGDKDYKAGQAIFGWRGAFPGSLTLISRLWEELTGETAIRKPLSVTFRCPPEVVDAVRALNATLTSGKPVGSGAAMRIDITNAFGRWLDLPETDKEGKPYRALWLTRRNAPLGEIFKETLRARKEVCLRGGGDFAASVDRALFEAAGWYDDNGDYKVSLKDCIDNLRELSAEEDENSGESMESFLLSIAEEIRDNPAILREAQLPEVATVGNLRRLVIFFANKESRRVLSTVYRAKGDEAQLTIVDDCEAFNSAWNNDSDEAAACRLVACTRASETLFVIGSLAGVVLQDFKSEQPNEEEKTEKPRHRRLKKEATPMMFE